MHYEVEDADGDGDDNGDDDGGWPVVGVGGECDVAGEDDDKLGEREVHQQPVYRGSELKGFEVYKKLRFIVFLQFSQYVHTYNMKNNCDFHLKNLGRAYEEGDGSSVCKAANNPCASRPFHNMLRLICFLNKSTVLSDQFS